MKYVVYWSMDPSNRVKASKIARTKLPELKKTDDFPKPLSVNYTFPGRSEGFRLYEAARQEQIANYCQLFGPLLDVEWVPIQEATSMTAATEKYGDAWRDT